MQVRISNFMKFDFKSLIFFFQLFITLSKFKMGVKIEVMLNLVKTSIYLFKHQLICKWDDKKVVTKRKVTSLSDVNSKIFQNDEK